MGMVLEEGSPKRKQVWPVSAVPCHPAPCAGVWEQNPFFRHWRDMPSTAVEFANYDPAQHVMLVKYRGGGLYRYFEVPQEEYEAYRASRSKGKFVNERIKPNYNYAKAS